MNEGVDIVKVISDIYTLSGPKIGPMLVEANIVLTMAGARGQTEFYIDEPTNIDREYITKIDSFVDEYGIRFRDNSKTFFSARSDKETLCVGIDNLKGYEKTSRLTRIPGVVPFDSTHGWSGLDQWIQDTLVKLGLEQATGNIKCDVDDLIDIYMGIVKGYPDQAIYDLIEADVTGRRKDWVSTDIPSVNRYGGAQPNFVYLPEHSNNSQIVHICTEWETILTKFYNSPWHQLISTTPDFIEGRRRSEL